MLYGKKVIGTVAYMGGVMTLPEFFCWSWGQMIQYNTEYLCQPGEIIHYFRSKVSYHSYARNTIVDNIQGEWLLMLDTDHIFDPDLCARLVHKMFYHDVDVLTGLYQFKAKPHSPVLYTFDEKDSKFTGIGDWDKDADIFTVDSAGAGCLLVRKSVFERIKFELGESPFDITPPFSEDHSFFLRLRKLGIKTYCAPLVESHHLSLQTITLNDYDKSGFLLSEKYSVEGKI